MNWCLPPNIGPSNSNFRRVRINVRRSPGRPGGISLPVYANLDGSELRDREPPAQREPRSTHAVPSQQVAVVLACLLAFSL